MIYFVFMTSLYHISDPFSAYQNPVCEHTTSFSVFHFLLTLFLSSIPNILSILYGIHCFFKYANKKLKLYYGTKAQHCIKYLS